MIITAKTQIADASAGSEFSRTFPATDLAPQVVNPVTYTGDPLGLSLSIVGEGSAVGNTWSTGAYATNYSERLDGLTSLTIGGAVQSYQDWNNWVSASLESFSLPDVKITRTFRFSANALTTLNMPKLESIAGGDFVPNINSLTTLSLPSLLHIPANCNFQPSVTSLVHLNLPSLLDTVGAFNPGIGVGIIQTINLHSLQMLNNNARSWFNIDNFAALTTLDLHSVATMNGDWTPRFLALTSLDLSSLAASTNNFSPTMPSLTTLSLPSLADASGTFAPVCAAVTHLDLSGIVTASNAPAALNWITPGHLPALVELNLSGMETLDTSFVPILANLTTFDLSSLTSLAGNLDGTYAAMASFSLPSLVTIDGDFSPVMDALTSFSAPLLSTIGGSAAFELVGGSLTSLVLPALTELAGGTFSPTMAALTTLGLPALTTVSGTFAPNCPSVTDLDLSGIITASDAALVFTWMNAGGQVPDLVSLDLSGLVTLDEHLQATLDSLTSLDLSSVVDGGASGGEVNGHFNSLTSLSLPNATNVGLSFSATSMVSLDIPLLEAVGSGGFDMTVGAMPLLSAPSLVDCDTGAGGWGPSGDMAAISMPVLARSAGIYPSNCSALTVLSLPALTDVTQNQDISIQDCPSLLEIDLPVLVNIASGVDLSHGGTDALTTFLCPSSLLLVGEDVNMTSCALDQSSVDSWLERLAAMDGTGGTTSYDNLNVTITGTSAAPSVSGAAAVVVLQGRGCTVTTN